MKLVYWISGGIGAVGLTVVTQWVLCYTKYKGWYNICKGE